MIDQLIKIFEPLTNSVKLFFERKDKKKSETLKMKETLVNAMHETRKAIALIKANREVSIDDQYKVADLWKDAFLIVSDSHPATAYTLMGKSNLWLTPEFWRDNPEAFVMIEKWFKEVEAIIFPTLTNNNHLT